MFISQSDTMQINMARQSQDEQNGQKIVFMERIKNMAILTSDTLTLMQMELDVHLNHGRYYNEQKNKRSITKTFWLWYFV